MRVVCFGEDLVYMDEGDLATRDKERVDVVASECSCE